MWCRREVRVAVASGSTPALAAGFSSGSRTTSPWRPGTEGGLMSVGILGLPVALASRGLRRSCALFFGETHGSECWVPLEAINPVRVSPAPFPAWAAGAAACGWIRGFGLEIVFHGERASA